MMDLAPNVQGPREHSLRVIEVIEKAEHDCAALDKGKYASSRLTRPLSHAWELSHLAWPVQAIAFFGRRSRGPRERWGAAIGTSPEEEGRRRT